MKHKTQRQWDRFARSGLLTVGVLLLFIAVAGAAWMAHLHGRFHRLTTTEDASEHAAVEARPGGQPLVRLTRMAMSSSMTPEFTQATVAPGMGMLMLQALLQVPGRAEEPILLGTSDAEAATAGNHLLGAEVHVTAASREGARWTAPVELVAGHAARQQNTSVLPDGARCVAVYGGDGASPMGAVVHTGVETTVSAATTSRGVELTITARNTGNGQRAVVLDWQPRFLIAQPGASYVPPKGADGERAPGDQPLGTHDIDHTYGALQHSFLSAGPEVLLHNRGKGYALRLTALSPAMHSVHIQGKKDDPAVLVAFSTGEGSGSALTSGVLMPGEKLEWRLRVQAVADTGAASTAP